MVRNVLVLLFVGLPAFAGGIVVSPHTAGVRVGEQITLHAADEPGGLSNGFPYSATFESDDPSIALISGYASGSGYLQPYPYPNNGTVYVTGIAQGVAHVIPYGYPAAKLATITVTDLGVTITPQGQIVRMGDAVTLVAMVNGGYSNVTLDWFLGRTGDTSHLINSGPLVRFQPQTAKTYVWLQAAGNAGGSTTAEIEIDALPRSRAVRH